MYGRSCKSRGDYSPSSKESRLRQEAFTDIFSPLFRGFTSRMWIDYLDENKSSFLPDDDYPTYLINNFKFLVRKFNEQNGNSEWNIK